MSDSPTTRLGALSPPDEGSDALPIGSRLAEFEIRQVLGTGGFGIVYRAWDEALHRDVALKEYMPVSLATRGAGERVTLRARSHEENFALGLQSFVNEARLLARFDQPALVKVLRFWEANGTAYMAMPLYEGRTLRQLRKEMAPGALNDAWLRALIEPLLGALEVMHDAAVFHRDIAPDNILWCDDDRPVLLDFGAARLVLSDRTQNVTAILKPQFAPIEQYAETQSMRQGPWTDIYALAGTCYFMLTGRAPLPATARVMGDELVPLVRAAPPGCSPRLLQILDWAMAVRPQDRPQSVGQLRDALAGRIDPPVRAAGDAPAATGAAPASAVYEKTIQATMRVPPTQRMPRSETPRSVAPPSRQKDADELERPERSVMLPPKAGLPFKPLLLLLVVAAAAAGAWTTRQQWMPMVGLQAKALPAAESASSAEAIASAPAMPVAASAPVADAASTPASASATLAAASDAAANVAAPPASAVESAAPLAVVEPGTAASRAAAARLAKEARSKALAAKLAALPLPPPVLPPANESQVGASGHAAVSTTPEAGATAAPAAASGVPRDVGPREVCADQGPNKMAACIKRLCETYPRFQRFPVCLRVRQQEMQTE